MNFVIFIVRTVFVLCGVYISRGQSTCYFPDYLQGEFLMQIGSSAQSQVQYTAVSISSEAISTWGFCLKKLGNNLYLIDNFNNTYCVRCFHISVKSQNIIIVRTTGNPERCFVTHNSAEASCPKSDQLDLTRQIILYKNSKEIKKEYCPINGRYTFQYKQNTDDHAVECAGRTSYIDNCPIGSELNIHFRNCQFENYDVVFECLGTWEAPNNQKYLALFDTRPGEDTRPQYRCALFREEPGSGTVYVAFSSDSTCITDLRNSQSGFETLVLTATPTPNSLLQITDRNCRFPNWLQGRWELVTVSGKTFVFADSVLFKTYTFQCLSYDDDRKYTDSQMSGDDDDEKILVHGKTHCGEEMYTCIWIKKRGPNVFEFQLGSQISSQYNMSLCSTLYFQTNSWITQARKEHLEDSPCPVLGEYIGMIPNTESLCAKLSSNCVSQDTMYYTVSDCNEIYFEGNFPKRKYRRARQITTEAADINKTSSQNDSSTPFLRVEDAREITTEKYSPVTASTEIDANAEPNTPPSSAAPPLDEPKSVINDSIAEESTTNNGTTDIPNVGSYFIENRNVLGDTSLPMLNGGPRVATFLPPPFGSSTQTPPYRQYPAPPPPAPAPPQQAGAQYYQTPYDYNSRYYDNGYRDNPPRTYYNDYRSQEQYRNTYYNQGVNQGTGWNRNRSANDYQTISSQMYVKDPMNLFAADRRTAIALPPIQLPPATMPRMQTYRPSSRRTALNYHTFKDREYKCLGQWQENGLTYTFTQRKYIGNYECFVGTVISETEFSVREAGKHCERKAESSMLSMILSRKSSCNENRNSSTSGTSIPSTTLSPPVPVTTIKYPVNKRPALQTTKTWKPLNVTRPQSPYRNKNNNTNHGSKYVPTPIFLVFSFVCIFFDKIRFSFTVL